MIAKHGVAHEAGEPELLAVDVCSHQVEAGRRPNGGLKLGAHAVPPGVAGRQPGLLHSSPGEGS